MYDLSPEPVSHLSQHVLLPMLLSCATAPDAAGRVCFGSAVTALTQCQDDRVQLTVQDQHVRCNLLHA